MVEPMLRPAVDWYTEGLTDFTKAHNEGLFGLQLANISVIKREDLPGQMFSEDYIHLTQSAGLQFLRAIVYFAEKIFEAQVVDLESETVRMEEDVQEGTSSAIERNTEKREQTTMVAEGSAVIAPKRSTVQEQIDDINTDHADAQNYIL